MLNVFSSSAVLYAQHSNSQCCQRDRENHFCVCGFIGATTERKAASEGIFFRNTYRKLVKEFTFVCSRLCLHSQSQQTLELLAWCVHELCPEQAAGAEGVCVSNPGSVLALQALSIFR